MTRDCGDPNCQGCHPPIGVQRAAPRRLRAIQAEAAVISLSLLMDNDAGYVPLPKIRSGNNFTPCDLCGKPTRDARCFKCRT